MKVEADRRSRRIEPAPEAERAARQACREIARAEATAAKALATIEQRRSYLLAGFPSVQAWARAEGFGPLQIRRLLRLGRTLVGEPDLEDDVAAGRTPAETAAHVGDVLREPTLELDEQEREDWKRKAREEDPRKVRDDAEQAVEDARQGAPTFPLRFRVTKKTRDGFLRIRLLMARGQEVMPTNSEVLGRMVQDYLGRHDPRERPLGRQTDPGGSGGPGKGRRGRRGRAVPKQVQVLVQRRSGGVCEICRVRRARELVHLKPFAQGGAHSVDNLADCCRDCHVLLDAGVFRFSRFDEAGRPVFTLDAGLFASMNDAVRGAHANADDASQVRERGPPAYGGSRRSRRSRRSRTRLREPPRGSGASTAWT